MSITNYIFLIFFSLLGIVGQCFSDRGFYIAGYVGLSSTKIQYKKISKINHSYFLKESLSDKVLQYLDISRKLPQACAEIEQKADQLFRSWGADEFSPGDDVTLLYGSIDDWGSIEYRDYKGTLVGLPIGTIINMDDAGQPYAGFGLQDDLQSLNRAQEKILHVFQTFRSTIAQNLSSLGFVVENVSTDSMYIVKKTGDAKSIVGRPIVVSHPNFPCFEAIIIKSADAKKGEWGKTRLGISSFSNPIILREQLTQAFLTGAGGRIMSAWNDILVNGDLEESSSLSAPLRAADILSKEGTMHFTMGMLAGYHKSFFRSEHAYYGTYWGAEMFYDVDCGAIKLKNPPSENQEAYMVSGKVFVYPSDKPPIHHIFHVKTRHAFGLTGFVGLATRKNWMIYFPLSARFTYYRIFKEKDYKSLDRYTENPKVIGLEGGEPYVAKNVSISDDDGLHNYQNSIQRLNCEGEGGVGIRLVLNPRMTLGFRWMNSFGSHVSFETPPYETKALHDMDRFGVKHRLDFNGQKFVLEWLWSLRR